MEPLQDYLTRCVTQDTYKLVLSAPSDAAQPDKRLSIRKLPQGWQIERLRGNQAFHENLSPDGLLPFLAQSMGPFRQLNAWDGSYEYSLRLSKKGKPLFHRTQTVQKVPPKIGHNRAKNYLLQEGDIVPPLVDMGIFTAQGKIVRTMYDKFRQINRFLELVRDELDHFPQNQTLHIIDFGCGKSYLTFILYYYLVEVRGMDVQITGLDLKSAVIEHCNAAAARYGYQNLHFELGDINGYTPNGPVDMVITLHACDTATDFALFNAISWDVKLILSVPCCQHEVNRQMDSSHLALFTRYGLIQDRLAALITDSVRANLLTWKGYHTQVVEFIDMAHTPKNILLRARKADLPEKSRSAALAEVEAVLEEFHLSPTLYRLLVHPE